MKRRTFLTTASTVGIASAVSGASVVNAAYTSISTSVLLKEFDIPTRKALDKFKAEMTLNVQSLGLEEQFATEVTMPVQIISKKNKRGSQSIVYKNKSGAYVSLSVTNGEERIRISNTL